MPGLKPVASSRNRDIFDPAHERDACGVGFVAEAERRCVRARKRAEKACAEMGIRVYFPSFSFSTITYKGMCLADKLADFYLDLADERYQVPVAIFHQRFSTNTLPTWERTQP